MSMPVGLLVLYLAFGPGGVLGSSAWYKNVTTDLFNLTGDILLGGLFSINVLSSNLSQRVEPDNITCDRIDAFGLGSAIVMKYTVDEINAKQNLLPGVTLGYEIFDTCKQSAVIVKPTLFFLTEEATSELAVMCNYTDYETRVAAVIGPQTSEMVEVIGKLLGFFLMPQISYGATSEQFSDKSLYPSFLRTRPSDKWQVEAMVQLMLEFDWNWVAVVGSDDEYGRQGQRRFSSMAVERSLCVAYEGLIPLYSDPGPVIVDILKRIEESHVQVVVVFALSDPAAIFFQEVIKQNMSGVWIASTAWVLQETISSLPGIRTVGTIIGFTDKTQTLGLLTDYTQELLTRISEESKGPPPAPDKSSSSPPHPCPDCWRLSLANISLVTAPLIQRTAFAVYSAIYSVAHALHNMLDCNATTCVRGAKTKIYPWQLLKEIKNISVNLDGTHLQFDSNGDPSIGYNILQWVWQKDKLEFKDVPQSKCSADCANGQVRRVKGFHSCCFDCINCTEGTYQANPDDIQCSPCPKGYWSLMSSTNCTLPTFEVLSWGSSISLGFILSGLVLLLCQGAVGVLFLQHRDSPLVRASGGALGAAALLSLVGGCLSQLLFLGQPGDLVCRLQLPLTSIFPTVALSTFLAISLQIFYVSEFPQKATSRPYTMQGVGGWLLVLACCGVQAGMCGWFIQVAPSLSNYVATMEVNFVKRFLACPVEPILSFGVIQGFNSLLALVSFMCTFMAVKTVRQYNLARDITFSTLIYCLIWVVFIPIYTASHGISRSIIHVSFSLLSYTGLVAAYYFPKCYLLLKNPELNTKEYFRTFLDGAPPTPEEEEQPQPEPASKEQEHE
ncbi:taste receptor type 1 member 3 [Aplochiton taeniatus]